MTPQQRRHARTVAAARPAGAPVAALTAALTAALVLLCCLLAPPAKAADAAVTAAAPAQRNAAAPAQRNAAAPAKRMPAAAAARCCQSPWLVVHTGGKVVRRPNPARYPYANQTNPYAGDPWGSTERQCVGYATWWLNAAGVNFGRLTKGPSGRVAQFGDATGWGAAARTAGWRVSSVPRVGAVAQWNAGEQSHWTVGNVTWTSWAGSSGHVAIVTAVYPDHTVQISEYNANGDRRYHSERTKAPRYLYIGL